MYPEPEERLVPRIPLIRELLANSETGKDLSEEEIRQEECRFFKYLCLWMRVAEREVEKEARKKMTPPGTSNPELGG